MRYHRSQIQIVADRKAEFKLLSIRLNDDLGALYQAQLRVKQLVAIAKVTARMIRFRDTGRFPGF